MLCIYDDNYLYKIFAHFKFFSGCRSKDCHIWTHPTIINIRGKHNHPVYCADALRYRDVSPETNQRLEALFRASYSPTAALDTLMHDLQLQEGDRYVFKSADRAICPDIAYCYRYVRATQKILDLKNHKRMHDSMLPGCYGVLTNEID